MASLQNCFVSHLNPVRCRETAMTLFVFSLLGMIAYTFTLDTGEIAAVYFTGALLGSVKINLPLL
jgi:hypothetical protein